MLERVRERSRRLLRRMHRIERREVSEFRDWIENTRNLIHVSILVFLPLLIGLVTFISNMLDQILPFLLFPPLASGTYTLFANPESKYASPRRFVGGLTAGALCGWIALELSARYWYDVPPGQFEAHAGAAAFGVLLTGIVTWALDIEESSAFSTSLLILVTGVTQLLYVVSVAVSTMIIAGVFLLWRRHFYQRRAEFLYQTTKGDDNVLVPMRGERAHPTAMLGASLAAAHDAGKVVLLDIVDDEDIAKAERELLTEEHDEPGHAALVGDGGMRRDDDVSTSDMNADEAEATEYAVAATTTALENRAKQIESEHDVPCEVIVAVGGGDPAGTVLRATADANCDLIATPYESTDGQLSGFLRTLFTGDIDVIVHRSIDGRTEWSNVLVPVRGPGNVAHAMIDFARRLAPDGEISVCHYIASEDERRSAEEMLADLVETFSGSIETRVTRTPIEDFLTRYSPRFDIIFIGASTDRSAASRFVSRPTFERIADVDTDVAIVHRG